MGIYQAGASYVKTQRTAEFTRLKNRSANRIIDKLKAQRGYGGNRRLPDQQVAEKFC